MVIDSVLGTATILLLVNLKTAPLLMGMPGTEARVFRKSSLYRPTQVNSDDKPRHYHASTEREVTMAKRSVICSHKTGGNQYHTHHSCLIHLYEL